MEDVDEVLLKQLHPGFLSRLYIKSEEAYDRLLGKHLKPKFLFDAAVEVLGHFSLQNMVQRHIKKTLDEKGFEKDKIEYFLVAFEEIYWNAKRKNKEYGMSAPSNILELYIPDRYTLFIENKGKFEPKKVRYPMQLKNSLTTKDHKIIPVASMEDHGRGIFLARLYTNELGYNICCEPEYYVEALMCLDKEGRELPSRPVYESFIRHRKNGDEITVLPKYELSDQVPYDDSLSMMLERYQPHICDLMSFIGYDGKSVDDMLSAFDEIYTNAWNQNRKRGIDRPNYVHVWYIEDVLNIVVASTGDFKPRQEMGKGMRRARDRAGSLSYILFADDETPKEEWLLEAWIAKRLDDSTRAKDKPPQYRQKV